MTSKLKQSCKTCRYFRKISLPTGGNRSLCAFLGELRPVDGMNFCHWQPGQWNDIDQILGLPKSRLLGNAGDPNYAKLGNGFFSLQVEKIIAKRQLANLDDSIGLSDKLHTRKRQFVCPGYRKAPAASIAGEQTGCLFCV